MIPFKPRVLLLLIPIVIIFFIFRLQNLTAIPVFGDEAIYIRWAQLIKNVETLRFVPLSDGKQPLFMWLNSLTLRLFSDPLVSGRLISVFSGAGTLMVIFLICYHFFSVKSALVVSFLYLTLPFTFFFDRLSTADTLLSFLGLLSLYLSLLLSRYPRLDLSLILGSVLGLAWLTKSPAIFFIILSHLTFIFYNPANFKKLYLPLISSIIAFIIFNILRLGPQFHQIGIRNLDYVWPIQEILKHPLDPLVPHLLDILNIYQAYLSFPLLLTFAACLFFFRRLLLNKNILIFFAWWILPLLVNALVAKVFTARYILFTLTPLIILMAVFISEIRIRHFIPFLLIISLINLFFIYRLSFQPFNVKLPSTETGYLADWTSGWGIKSASDYLIGRSHQANIIVGTEGHFGTLPDGLQIYTDSLPRLTVIGSGINLTRLPENLLNAHRHGDEVYLLFNKSRLKLLPDQLYLVTLVQSYPKPDGDSLELYQVTAKL